MEMRAQEITAVVPSMSIIDGKIKGFLSIFSDVEDDANPIFIVGANDTFICVHCIATNYSIFPVGGF